MLKGSHNSTKSLLRAVWHVSQHVRDIYGRDPASILSHQTLRSLKSLLPPTSQGASQPKTLGVAPDSSQPEHKFGSKQPPPSKKFPHKNAYPLSRPLVFVVTITSLTALMGQRFYNQPELDVGRIAPTTILAPDSARVEDKKKTEENRKVAKTGAIPILQVDLAINQQIYQDLQRWLAQGEELRSTLGSFPVVTTQYIPLSTQLHLRQMQEQDWLTVIEAVNQASVLPGVPANPTSEEFQSTIGLTFNSASDGDLSERNIPDNAILNSGIPDNHILDSAIPDSAIPDNDVPDNDVPDSNIAVDLASELRERSIDDLLDYRRQRSPQEFTNLLNLFSQAREDYTKTLSLLAGQLNDLNDLSDFNSEDILDPLYGVGFLNFTDSIWQDTQVGIYTALERLLTQGIAPGTPDEIIERAVRLQVSLTIPASAEPLAVTMLLRVIQPNLVPDPEQTKAQAEQAAESVEPVYVDIRQGEPIIRVGEEITQAQFVLLDHFGKSKRSPNWTGLMGFSLVVLIGVGIFILISKQLHPKMRCRDYVLILLLTVSTPLLVLLRVPTTSLPAVGILMGSFYGSTLGTVTVGLLAVGLPLGLDLDPNLLFPGAAGGFVAALVAGQLRSREELALLGACVGLTQGMTDLLLGLILTSAAGQVWYLLLPGAGLSGSVGVLWCIGAFGLSPYLEHLFDLLTPIRLAELSNPNRPMLQRLASEAPGTFQHTLFVSTLAEAAARNLRCNVELVRAGTLYHDIGKMHDPQGFIENQMGGPNKHDEIKNPWTSAEIIKKHVSEGLVMARKCRLPRALQSFIPEHQGTMLIAYFHHAAKELEHENPAEYTVQETDFRYPGPIPQSRETGIVMLADSCEAALRSLKDATPEQALAMVMKIIRARWEDNQLIDSGLKREEMDTIAQVFVQIWQQFHHQRIPYPSPAPAPTNALSAR